MASKINILFIGDIVGDPGMKIVRKELPELISKYNSQYVIVNGENIVNGKGLSETEAEMLYKLGAHTITTGNHIWENWKSRPLLASDNRVLRPLNYPQGNPGNGFGIYECGDLKIGVIQVQGRTFLQSIDCPFKAMDFALKHVEKQTSIIIVDFHAEATAEKVAMGWYLDGKVSAVIGTHTHIQTADASILPLGTAYITDVGMTGPYDSVLGMRKDIALKRMLLQTAHKYEMASDDVKISGIHLEIDAETGQALKIEPFVHPKFVRSVQDSI